MNQIYRKSPFWSLAGPLLAYLAIRWAVEAALMMLILMDRGLEGLWYVTPSAALLTAAAAVAVYFLRIRHFMEEKEGV